MNVGSIASSGWKYIQRAGRLYPDFVLGTGNEAFSNALRSTVKNRAVANQNYFQAVWSGTKKGVHAAEAHNNTMIKRHGGFWKSNWAALKSFPAKVKQGWRVGGKLADKAGKTGFSKFWSQFKGSLSGIGKRMPLIGTLLIAVTELPNIFSAFKDKGLAGGVAETGKAGLRLGAGMAGAAIGQALIPIPIVGGLVGYIAGDWLMSKFTGKSHSEKKAEAEQAQLAQQQQQQTMMQQYGANPYAAAQMANNPSANKFSIPQPTVSAQELMAIQRALYSQGAGNPMDQDFMAMTSGINRLNYQC